MAEATFGRGVAQLTTTSEFLAAEVAAGKKESFSSVSELFDPILLSALRGEELLAVKREGREEAIALHVPPTAHEIVERLYAVAAQQRRGAWYLPDKASIKAGWINFGHFFLTRPRYATGIASEQRARVVLAEDPSAVFAWAVLEPLFERIYLPFQLRGDLAGKKSREDQIEAWASVDAFYGALELDLSQQLAVLRFGGGWSGLTSDQQLAAKTALLDGLRGEVGTITPDLYRAHEILRLTRRYYKAAKDGQAKRRQVVTRDLQRVLSGFFEGDWLRFVAYLGEEPHPEEVVATALPETRLFVGGSKTADDVAAETGMPVSEVERVMGTYWRSEGRTAPSSVSPVQRRVNALREFWVQFDVTHARQASGMPSLWGLVEEGDPIRLGWQGPEWFMPGQYRKLLPAAVVTEIEDLWGAVMLPRWPDRIVSEISPHALMAQTLGPALSFWHGCALTAWFHCEGPMSRTDISGLRSYYRDELREIAELGCPIPNGLFEDLAKAERLLGQPEPVREQTSTSAVADGLSLTISYSIGQRRPGFHFLREVIDTHRREWTDSSLEAYLRARWESDLSNVGRDFSEFVAERAKQPSAKQFAKFARTATNRWFGGDLNNVYAALGEKSPVHPTRQSLMPADRLAYAATTYRLLGGNHRERERVVESRDAGHEQNVEIDKQNKLSWLAEQAPKFTQLEEALGREPDLKAFGEAGFVNRCVAIDRDPEIAWGVYRLAVAKARRPQPAVVADAPPLQSNAAVPISEQWDASGKPKRSIFRRLLGG